MDRNLHPPARDKNTFFTSTSQQRGLLPNSKENLIQVEVQVATTKQTTFHESHAANLHTQRQDQQAHDDGIGTPTHLSGNMSLNGTSPTGP